MIGSLITGLTRLLRLVKVTLKKNSADFKSAPSATRSTYQEIRKYPHFEHKIRSGNFYYKMAGDDFERHFGEILFANQITHANGNHHFTDALAAERHKTQPEITH